SAKAITLYLFYEFLTLITTPLVFHTQTKEAIRAARKYLYYSIGGAAVGFIAVIFIMFYGNTTAFTYGGVMNIRGGEFDLTVMRVVYVLAFVGFGVKSAIFPLHGWLPTVSVAPTPVTALLHAVAVVKSGAFVIMRMTFYVFGTELLEDSWAQMVVTLLAVITILYGSSMAVKEQHFKRRLAYSTI
ncbi:MAG: proton-conducting transporter membrane subunit, partial [Oscillospiraceae bacterium]